MDTFDDAPGGRDENPFPQVSDANDVLLQIALAFTIILGYLLCEGLAARADLAGRLVRTQKNLDDHVATVIGFEGSELGKEMVKNFLQEQEIQEQKLRRAWSELRPEQPLARRLAELGNAGRIALPREKGFLPDETAYSELLKAARGVFGKAAAGESVSRDVVRELLEETCRRAGLHAPAAGRADEATRRAFSDQPALPRHVGLVEAQKFRPEVPSLPNLITAASQIRKDLEGERERLARLQFALVERIALLRPDSTGSTDADTVLRRTVSELNEPLGLLPEVTSFLTSR